MRWTSGARTASRFAGGWSPPPLRLRSWAGASSSIAAAGPGGVFIDTDHTAGRFRRELWFPRLLDRQFYEAWRTAGAESVETRCRRRTEEILATHRPEPIAEDLDRELDRIVAAARRHLETP